MKLFVYGTLKPGEERWHAISEHISHTYKATATDCRLYDLGPFPAMVRMGNEQVKGFIVETNDPWTTDILLTITDAIEGRYYGLRPIRTTDDTTDTVWSYIWTDHRLIENEPIVEEWTRRSPTMTTNKENN